MFGAVGLVSIRKAAEFGGKTTIDKLGRQIIVDIASGWSLVDEHKAEELAIVKAHYRITFVAKRRNQRFSILILLFEDKKSFRRPMRKLWRSQIKYICVKLQAKASVPLSKIEQSKSFPDFLLSKIMEK